MKSQVNDTFAIATLDDLEFLKESCQLFKPSSVRVLMNNGIWIVDFVRDGQLPSSIVNVLQFRIKRGKIATVILDEMQEACSALN